MGHELQDFLEFMTMICVPIALVTIPFAFRHSIARRLEGKPRADSDELLRAVSDMRAQLAAIQMALDAVAVEVERQGELQRFAARMPNTLPRVPGSITPH